ncbi:MAG: 50S ribosomal protein L23 [Candidatus Bathyarchaeia archaeon]
MGKVKPHEVILYPLISEETVTLIERENKITFIVNPAADKGDVKRAVKELYEVDVDSVNTLITRDGRKKAYVKFKPEYKAADLAVKLGIL